MKKFLSGFFLPLSILLLNGYGMQYAYACQDNPHITKKITVENSLVKAAHGNLASTENAMFSDKANFKIVIMEVEEDENKEQRFASFKRNVVNNSYVVALFYLALIGYACGRIKKSRRLNNHFLYPSSNKWYLQLSVFRI